MVQRIGELVREGYLIPGKSDRLDGHVDLVTTPAALAMEQRILDTIDRVGYSYINILGGAVFDVCVRFLHDSPWERVALLCDRLRTPCDGLTRGQSLYTFELFPDDVVALNSQVLARLGVAVLTVYDALNDNRNVASSVVSGHEAGMKVNAMMTYTLSPVHTDAYYVDRTRELVALEADFISIKDPTGLLTPERAKTLFPAVVAAAGSIPVQLHSHCQSGLAPQVYGIAVESGFRYGYTASEPLANGASLPSTEEVDERACALGATTVEVSLPNAKLAIPAYYVIAPKGLPAPVLSKLIELSKKVVQTEDFKAFVTANGYTLDPKAGDDMKKELDGYGKLFKEVNDYLESTK